METKILELRDRATFIPVVAIYLDYHNASEEERYLLGSTGWGGGPWLMLAKLIDFNFTDYYTSQVWMNRAHDHIKENWHSIPNYAVVDMEFVRGESVAPKQPQRLEDPMVA